MDFRIGQKVVYPNHGLGVIEAICIREVCMGQTSEFYQLRLLATNSIVMIPTANAREVGLRPPITPEGCHRLFQILAEDFEDPPMDWKGRYKEFTERMRTGDIFEIAHVLKTLAYLNTIKPLSFREKRLLEKARYLVVSEVAEALRRSVGQIDPLIDQALEQACMKHHNGRTPRAFAAGK